MLYQNLRKRTEGFTIIEVLIVLAIAGLILLIVFLAVPALQRNSRNTQRREDVTRILSAVVEASNNVNWNISGFGPFFTMMNQAVPNMGNMTIYQNLALDGSGNLKYGNPGDAADADVNNFKLFANGKCQGETAVVAQQRSIAVLYQVETGTGTAVQCESS